MENLVSIIVPIYGVENYLNKCIESLVNQTYQNIEIILVDDGSLDSCPKICDDWGKKDKRIKVLHKQNGGVSSARNLGIEKSTGKFFIFVDPDDWIELDMIEKLLNKQKTNDYDLVLCNFKKIYIDKVINIKENLEEFSKTKDIVNIMRHQHLIKLDKDIFKNNRAMIPTTCRTIYKREKFKDIRFDLNLTYSEDLVFLTKIYSINDIKIGYIEDCLYNYYIRESSLCHGVVKNFVNKNINFIETVSPILQKSGRDDLINAEKFFSYYMCVANNIKYKNKEDLSPLKAWNNYVNYKAHKQLCNGFISRLKAFLVHYKLSFVLKFANIFFKRGK